MTSEPTAFDTFISDYARLVGAGSTPTLEAVAANVTRASGFTNLGIGASGHRVDVDEPTAFGGGGTAADPAELLLIAVGASLSVTITVHASLAAVPVDAIDISLHGTLDAGRFFDPSAAPGGGFGNVDIAVTVRSLAPPTAVRAVLDAALLASPVLRSLAVATAATLTVNGTIA